MWSARKEIIRNVEEFTQICKQTVEENVGECGGRFHFMSDYIEENCFALLLSSDRADLLMKEEQGTECNEGSGL